MKMRARSAFLFVAMAAVGAGFVPAFAGVASATPTLPPAPPVNQNAPAHAGTACYAILTNNPNTTPPGFPNGFAEDIFEQVGYTMGCFS